MSASSSEGFTVVGGAGGIEADLEDMDVAGSRIRTTGLALGEMAVRSHRHLVDGNLLLSAPLAPTTFAAFQTSLLSALDGGTGVSASAVRMTAAGSFMQAAARGYLAMDEALERLSDARQQAQGRLVGAALAASPVATLISVLGALGLAGALDDPVAWLLEHPDVLEEIVASSSGTLDLFIPGSGFPSDAAEGAALLALLYDQELGSLESHTVDANSPGGLADVLARLEEVGVQEGGFAIEEIDGRYVVYLPGTEVFDGPFAPGSAGIPDGLEESDLVRSLGTNFAAVGGSDNAYVDAVLQALEALPPGAEVALVGHSQGGIVAARVAEAVAGRPDPPVQVRQVVTAGSPVDHIELPEEVQVLSLVNEHDIVPRLDGEAVDDRSNHTTVVVEQQLGSVGENHSIPLVYAPLGAAIDGSSDPSVVAATEALRDVLGGQPSSSTIEKFVMGRP